jgi:molybdopterin/thiamine biosynthesis adenylyltransferase
MAFELTESEAQRYDRQIRVWGAEAQSRIQNSKVLVCGLSKMNVEVRHLLPSHLV